MRKITSKILTMVMVLTFIFSFGYISKAAENKLEVTTEVGFSNNYKAGYLTPVTFTIKNPYKNINGEIEVKVPTNNNKYVSYVRPLNIEKDAEKVITINIPLQMDPNRIKCEVVINNEKEIVYEGIISFSYVSNNVTKFIGVLSDDYEGLTYINRISSTAGNMLITKNMRITEKDFPEDYRALKSLDLLIINNFDSSKLNNKQYEALKQWVTDGGTLIIGTGTTHSKALGIFKDDFIKGKVAGVSKINTSKIYDMATNGESNEVISLEVATLQLQDSTTLLEDKGVKLIQKLTKAKGSIGVVAFDLAQLPFNGLITKSAFAENLISSVNNSIAIDQVQYDYNNSYQIREALNNFSEMGFPKANNFFAILAIYILVVAPINYIVLKKLDKREYMWISVPAIAVIFGLVVYISGLGTRVNKLTTNMVSFIDLNKDGSNNVSTYTGIITSKKMKLRVEGKETSSLWPIVDNFYGDPNSHNNDQLEVKIYTGEENRLEYYNTSILQTKAFKMEQGQREMGKIETDIKFKDGKFVGTLRNSTNLDFEECFIITPGEYYKIEGLKIGESKSIGNSTTVPYNYIHEFINTMYNRNYNRNYSSMSDEEKKKQIDINQKSSILSMYFENGKQRINGINVVAFSKTPFNNPFVINDSEPAKNERSLIVMPLDIKFVEGDSANLPYGFVPYDVIPAGLNYDTYANRLFGIGSAEILFRIDNKIAVEEVQFKGRIQSYGISKLYIYNKDTKVYEEFDFKTLKVDEVSKYIDDSNTLKLKVEMNGKNDEEIPQISVKGKVK